jgi:hypothetical protein
VVFIRPYVTRLPKIEADFTAQENMGQTICMGVVIINPNERTRDIFPASPVGGVVNDEDYANDMIRQKGCSVVHLDRGLFLIGARPFSKECSCYHYNFRIGIEQKVADMKSDGNWLL